MSEPMKILIAYDGSECAAAVLDDLKRAGLPRDAHAIVEAFRQRLRGARIARSKS